MRISRCAIAALAVQAAWAPLLASPAEPQRNVILFVADGLRHDSVTQETAPALYRLMHEGVAFADSHAIFPTFTAANASALATGHYLGDTGDFSVGLGRRPAVPFTALARPGAQPLCLEYAASAPRSAQGS